MTALSSTNPLARLLRHPRNSGRPPLSPLWKAFTFGWLVVYGIVLYLLPEYVSGSQLWAASGCLLLLAALYLYVTLHDALDLQVRTDAAHTRRKLMQLGMMLVLVVVLRQVVPGMGMWWLMQHAVVAAGLTLPPRIAAVTVGVLVGSSVGLSVLDRGTVQPMLLIQLSFGAAGMAIRQLTLTVEELRAARAQVARMAVAEERKRFGRDLHDLLGHSLSAIVLKSELAQRMFASSPQRSLHELREIERAARAALQSVRAAVAGYHQPTLEQELSAAAELLEAAGIRVSVDRRVPELTTPRDAFLAWTVREAVTNVLRHSRATRCEIHLDRKGDSVLLEVLDDGQGAAQTAAEGGTGLIGLGERAAAVGGRLWTERTETGGFALRVAVPVLEVSP